MMKERKSAWVKKVRNQVMGFTAAAVLFNTTGDNRSVSRSFSTDLELFVPPVTVSEVLPPEIDVFEIPELAKAPAILTPVPERVQTLYDRLMEPLINEAYSSRLARASADPAYARRINSRLASDRVNILLYGYGETFEPPNNYAEIIGSYTLVSYNFRTRKIDLVSLTHDIRAPEIERARRERGLNQRTAVKIDQAYKEPNRFDLMRLIVENATGFPVDFIGIIPDTEIASLVDDVLGGVEVTVPSAVGVNPFYMKGERYPARVFQRGRQKLSGVEAVGYIKTVPNDQLPAHEHNVRKAQVGRAIVDSVKDNVIAPWFWWNTLAYLSQQGTPETIEFDFDPKKLLVDNIGSMMWQFITSDHSSQQGLPQINKEIYIHDPKSGAGGVRWAASERGVNRFVNADYLNQVYADPNMAVPVGGNANATDLVSGYWPNLRYRIQQLVLG